MRRILVALIGLSLYAITLEAQSPDYGGYRPEFPPFAGFDTLGGQHADAIYVFVDTLTAGAGLTSCSGTCGGLVTSAICDTVTCYHGGIKAALEAADEHRIICPTVSGTIDLGETDITITGDFFSLVGQCAPVPGLQLIKGGINVYASDGIIQHIRIRPGDGGTRLAQTAAHNALLIGYLGSVSNVWVDHVSLGWAGGKNLQIFGESTDSYHGPIGVGVWRTINHEALWRAKNVYAIDVDNQNWDGQVSSLGMHIATHITDSITVGESLSAHNMDRAGPAIGADSHIHDISNIYYDWGKDAGTAPVPNEVGGGSNTYPWAFFVYESLGDYSLLRANVIGNKYIAGPSTTGLGLYAVGVWHAASGAQLYLSDIAKDEAHSAIADFFLNAGQVDPRVGSPALSLGSYIVPPSSTTEARVLANAGAFPAFRDTVDIRIITETIARTGGRISSQDDVGGFPTLAAHSSAPLDIPTTPNAAGTCGSNGATTRSRFVCWAETRALQIESSVSTLSLSRGARRTRLR